jgi:hypothetical protein
MLVDEAHQAQLNLSGPQLACCYLNKEMEFHVFLFHFIYSLFLLVYI